MGDLRAMGAEGGTGDQCAEALGDALQMMVQALSQMHVSMQTMELKMEKASEAVRDVTNRMQKVEEKLEHIERKIEPLDEQTGQQLAPPQKEEVAAKPKDQDKDKLRVAFLKQPSAEPSVPKTGSTSLPTLTCPSSARAVRRRNSSRLPTPQRLPAGSSSSASAAAAPAAPATAPAQSTSSTSAFRAAPGPASTPPPPPPQQQQQQQQPAPPASSKGRLASRSIPPRAPAAVHTSPPRAKTPSSMCKRRSATVPHEPTARRESLGRKLMKAAQDGRTKEVRTLLQQGADPNFSNRSKWTPLHMAAMKAQTDVVSLLLEKGANLNARNTYGFTALHLAAKYDYTGLCACFLIYAGCNVDSRNHFGRTALHYAVESNNQAAVRALVVGGAKKGLRDHEGRAPYDLAKTEVVKRFVRF